MNGCTRGRALIRQRGNAPGNDMMTITLKSVKAEKVEASSTIATLTVYKQVF